VRRSRGGALNAAADVYQENENPRADLGQSLAKRSRLISEKASTVFARNEGPRRIETGGLDNAQVRIRRFTCQKLHR
jgi:hypothetical protein